MTDPMAMLAERYAFNTTVLRGLARDMAPADWSHRHGDTSPAHWILGHIARYRRMIARKIGLDIHEDDWEALVSKGSTPDDLSGYPDPKTLVAELAAQIDPICERMQALDDSGRAEIWATFAGREHDVESGLSFLYFHETYHVGQLSMLRRIAGKPGAS